MEASNTSPTVTDRLQLTPLVEGSSPLTVTATLAGTEETADLTTDEVKAFDTQLGWDVFEIIQAQRESEEATTTPPTFPDLETLTEAAVDEWVRAARFHRNGGNDHMIRTATLVERVAVTLSQRDPNLTAAEALRIVKTTTARLRSNLQEDVALVTQSEPTPETTPEPEPTAPNLGAELLDFSQFPTPDLMDYVTGDPDVAYFLKTGTLPTFSDRATNARREARRQIRDRARMYHLEGNRLYRLSRPKAQHNQPPPPTEVKRPVLAASEREAVIRHVHQTGCHPNLKNTLKLIRDRFWWKTLEQDVTAYVTECPTCQLANQPTTERSDGRTLTPTQVDLPWEKVGVDLMGPFPPTPEGYRYVAMLEDYHTHYVLGEMLYTNESEEVAAWLRRDLFAHHGTPAVMVMDNGLACGAVKELCHEKGTYLQPLPAHSPWINGLAESCVKHCKRGVRKLRADRGDLWPKYFHDLLFTHRICVRSSTLYSSFQMVYGREPVLPVERLFAQRHQVSAAAPDTEVDQAVDSCLEEVIATRRLNALLRAARQNQVSRAASFNQDIRQQQAIDAFGRRQHRGAYRVSRLIPGTKVIMRKARKQHPLDLGWEGPYTFVGFLDTNGQVAILEDVNKLRWTRHVTFLHDYRESDDRGVG